MSQLKCLGCECFYDESLPTSCDHNYCLPCLAYSYLNYLNNDNGNGKIWLTCDICQSRMEIDQDAAEILEQVLKKILIEQDQSQTSQTQNSQQAQENSFVYHQKSNEQNIKQYNSREQIQNYPKTPVQSYQSQQYVPQEKYSHHIEFNQNQGIPQQKKHSQKEFVQNNKALFSFDAQNFKDYKNMNGIQAHSIQQASPAKFLMDYVKKIDINEYEYQQNQTQLLKKQIDNDKKKFKNYIQRYKQELFQLIDEKLNDFESIQDQYFETLQNQINYDQSKIKQLCTFYSDTNTVLYNNKQQDIQNLYNFLKDQNVTSFQSKLQKYEPFSFENFQQNMIKLKETLLQTELKNLQQKPFSSEKVYKHPQLTPAKSYKDITPVKAFVSPRESPAISQSYIYQTYQSPTVKQQNITNNYSHISPRGVPENYVRPSSHDYGSKSNRYIKRTPSRENFNVSMKYIDRKFPYY